MVNFSIFESCSWNLIQWNAFYSRFLYWNRYKMCIMLSWHFFSFTYHLNFKLFMKWAQIMIDWHFSKYFFYRHFRIFNSMCAIENEKLRLAISLKVPFHFGLLLKMMMMIIVIIVLFRSCRHVTNKINIHLPLMANHKKQKKN